MAASESLALTGRTVDEDLALRRIERCEKTVARVFRGARCPEIIEHSLNYVRKQHEELLAACDRTAAAMRSETPSLSQNMYTSMESQAMSIKIGAFCNLLTATCGNYEICTLVDQPEVADWLLACAAKNLAVWSGMK